MLALYADNVKLDQRTVALEHRIVRNPGVGLVRKRRRKGGKSGVLKVP